MLSAPSDTSGRREGLVAVNRGRDALRAAVRWSTGAIVLSFAAMPGAQGQHMNAPEAPCQNVGSGATQTSCLVAATQAADAALNRTYEQIIAVLAKIGIDRTGAPANANVQRLRRAEQAWLVYRDTSCDAEYALYNGASGGPPAHMACLEALTRHRVTELDATYGWLARKFAPPSGPAR